MGVFDLWALLAGLALVIAAVLVASQDVVLDYVMGVLILVEGPFFKGDWVVVDDTRGVMQGEVQEIGLRRTVLRDNLGNVFAVSNGLIRASTNMTRVYSVSNVELQVLRIGDLDPAIAIVNRVGRELQADPEWSDEHPSRHPRHLRDGAHGRRRDRSGSSFGSRRAQARASRARLRRRLAVAFTAESIGIARWDTPMPIITQPAGPGTPVSRRLTLASSTGPMPAIVRVPTGSTRNVAASAPPIDAGTYSWPLGATSEMRAARLTVRPKMSPSRATIGPWVDPDVAGRQPGCGRVAPAAPVTPRRPATTASKRISTPSPSSFTTRPPCAVATRAARSASRSATSAAAASPRSWVSRVKPVRSRNAAAGSCSGRSGTYPACSSTCSVVRML